MSIFDQGVEFAILSADKDILGEILVLEEGLFEEGGLKLGPRKAAILLFRGNVNLRAKGTLVGSGYQVNNNILRLES